MIARSTPRVIPEKRRYWTIQVDDHSSIAFRFPYYQTAYKVIEFVSNCPTDGAPTQAKIAEMLPYMGAAIGAAWFHEALDLEAELDLGALAVFGVNVADELQEEEFTILQIVSLFNQVVAEMQDRMRITVEAEDVAVFSEAPAGAPTT